jgi:O-antigen/teichoic acid export membrane protein
MFNSPFKSVLARNTAWMLLGQGLRLSIQALYFVEIARSLGTSNYGAFIGVVALVGILFPFAALGSGNVLIQNVSRDKSLFPTYWGRALTTTLVSSSTLIAVVLLLSHFVLPRIIPLRLVMLVGSSDLVGLSLITLSSQCFQTFERLNWTATINVLISMCRLAGALVLIALRPHPSALDWGYFYFGSTAVVAATSMSLVRLMLGAARFNWRRSASEAREGFYFSAGLSAQTLYNDIDKTMLARLGTLDAAGIYGAAYRIIDVSFAPVSSLLSAAYPNFFRAGARGLSSSFAYAKPLLRRALGYSTVICAVLLLSAGLVPHILGAEFERTATALRWLAPLPVLKAMHYFLSDSLTGAGYQGVRTCIQAGVALFNVLINLWIIPAYSWRGAAWSSIASDVLLAGAVGTAVFILSRRPRNAFVELMAPAECD